MASAIGVARMPTQGSWRPCVSTIVGSPRFSMDRRGSRMLECGVDGVLHADVLAPRGVVAPVRLAHRTLAALVDGPARQPNAGCRLDRDAHDDVLAAGDAAQDPAGVVAEKTLRRHLIAVLA